MEKNLAPIAFYARKIIIILKIIGLNVKGTKAQSF